MIFLWTKSSLVGSKLIRWGLDEPCSHFAICFFENHGASALVIESRVETGVQPCWLGDFLGRNEIVHALHAPIENVKAEAKLFHQVGSRLQGRKYDKNSVAFWSAMALRRKFFGTKMPPRNEWGRSELVYCVEVLEAMPEYLTELGVALNLEMTSPEMAYNILRENEYLQDITEHFKSVDSPITDRRAITN